MLQRIMLDRNLNKVVLSNQIDIELRPLSVIEIFNLFLRKKGELLDIEQDSALKNVKFAKEFGHLKYEINLGNIVSEIKIYIDYRTLTEIPINSAPHILDQEYIIQNSNWIPISKESLEEFRMILEIMNPDYLINTNKAVNLLTNQKCTYGIKKELKLKDTFLDHAQPLKDQTSTLFEKELYDYQKEGLAWLKFCVINGVSTILGDDMGLGKTAQIIATICWALEKQIISRALIVVPATLLENWKREFAFFSPKISPKIHHGHDRSGIASSLRNHQVVITSYSLIINDFFLLNEITWDLTILDEASLIKNPQSERTLKLKSLNSIVKIAMTGTPVENSLLDLWSIADYLMPGYLGTEIEFSQKYIGRNIDETLSNDLLPLKNQVSQLMLRRMKVDLLDTLPEKIDIHQALRMNDDEESEYKSIEENILNSAQHNKQLSLKLISELRQFTTHPLLLSNNNSNITSEHALLKSKKFERTIELLEEIRSKKEKVLIFTGYITMIDIFSSFLPSKLKCKTFTIDGRVETSERQRQIDAFSAEPGFAIMILNPTTAAVGLNITAANHVIHYSRQWNPAIEIQASARAYRNGQKKGVNIYYLYYADTIEQTIDDRLRAKESLSGEVIQPASHSDDEYGEILQTLISSKNTK